jgi:hypothetical protein
MAINTKFDDLTVVEHGLILKNGKKKEMEISFSELNSIYVKMYKLKPVYELAFILFPFLLIFLSIQYLALEKLMFLGFFAIVPVFAKINNFKSYGLVVCLKDGTVFRKKVSLNLKGEYVSIVNLVRKEQLNHRTKINASCKSEVLEFC